MLNVSFRGCDIPIKNNVLQQWILFKLVYEQPHYLRSPYCSGLDLGNEFTAKNARGEMPLPFNYLNTRVCYY